MKDGSEMGREREKQRQHKKRERGKYRRRDRSSSMSWSSSSRSRSSRSRSSRSRSNNSGSSSSKSSSISHSRSRSREEDEVVRRYKREEEEEDAVEMKRDESDDTDRDESHLPMQFRKKKHRRRYYDSDSDEARPKVKSRWDDDSSRDKIRGHRERGGSGERLINAMKGESTDKEFEWGKPRSGPATANKIQPKENKAKPNFGLSGKLAEETNTFNGVIVKYSEPSEARKPKRRWRLYQFKGEEVLPTLYIHRQSAYLIGRERKVADIPIDHPSCSKQHAALQYRLVAYTRDDGTKGQRVRPYIIDLESANGTYINNVKIEPRKYVELFEKDVIKFAYSSREYVLLHEHSQDDQADDNVPY